MLYYATERSALGWKLLQAGVIQAPDLQTMLMHPSALKGRLTLQFAVPSFASKGAQVVQRPLGRLRPSGLARARALRPPVLTLKSEIVHRSTLLQFAGRSSAPTMSVRQFLPSSNRIVHQRAIAVSRPHERSLGWNSDRCFALVPTFRLPPIISIDRSCIACCTALRYPLFVFDSVQQRKFLRFWWIRLDSHRMI